MCRCCTNWWKLPLEESNNRNRFESKPEPEPEPRPEPGLLIGCILVPIVVRRESKSESDKVDNTLSRGC